MPGQPDIREKLRRLGRRRDTAERQRDQLGDEIEAALREAYGEVPVAEAARLLGVHRTSIYRVWAPHERARAA